MITQQGLITVVSEKKKKKCINKLMNFVVPDLGPISTGPLSHVSIHVEEVSMNKNCHRTNIQQYFKKI